MKFTRTAVALGAAALIAAGSVPAVQHFAEGDADKPVTTLSPAATTVQTSLPTSTTSTTTSSTTSPTTTTSATTSPATSTPTSPQETPKVVETTVVPETPSTSLSSTAATTAEAEPTDEHPNVKPLGEAPKTYQGKDQRWVRILSLIHI